MEDGTPIIKSLCVNNFCRGRFILFDFDEAKVLLELKFKNINKPNCRILMMNCKDKGNEFKNDRRFVDSIL